MHGTGRKVAVPLAFAAAVLVLLLFTSGCTAPFSSRPAESPEETPGEHQPSWTDIPLTDIRGRGIFTIGALSEHPVLVALVSESCPSCIILLRRQLEEIDGMPGVQNNTITAVALDLDPAFGPGFVAKQNAGFTGLTARAPETLSLQLLQELGPFAVDPTQVPVILVCPGRDAVLLSRGVKTTATLAAAIIREC